MWGVSKLFLIFEIEASGPCIFLQNRSSGDIYIGSTNGARGLLNGDLVSLAVYDTKQTLIATSSQPITGVTFGGLVDYNGNYYSGAKYGYTANALSYYNSDIIPVHILTAIRSR